MALATKLWVNRRLGDTRPDLTHPRRLLWSGDGGGIDYDYVYVGGRKYAVTAEKTSNFLQVNNDGTSSWVAAMPDVMPTNAEVYDVTKNEIHLPGEMAE